MKILFVTGAYPRGAEQMLIDLGKGTPLSIAANTFQWAIIEGLENNNADYNVVSYPFVPCFPFHFKKIYSPNGLFEYNGHIIGSMESFFNVSLLSEYSVKSRLKQFVKQWAEDNKDENQLIVLVYSPCSQFIEPLIKVKEKVHNLRICAIVTDLADDYNNPMYDLSLYRRIINSIEVTKIKRSYKNIDSFILLTKQMEELIPEAKGRSIVIEGVCHNISEFVEKQETPIKTLLYSGSLGVHTSVDHLVDAFMTINNPNYRLIICGGGDLENYVIEKSKLDSRIDYKGILPREEVLLLQKKATAVINPRLPSVSVTRYSFPSKTMEYMSSGTPFIGYKLEGIPEEYYSYYYTIDGESKKELSDTITKVLSLPQKQLNQMAKKAYIFMRDSKSAKNQVAKIITFLNKY